MPATAQAVQIIMDVKNWSFFEMNKSQVLRVCLIGIAVGFLAMPVTAQTSYDGQDLQTKVMARMTSLNALLSALEARVAEGETFRRNVIRCSNRDKVYMPHKGSADGQGCVGFGIRNTSGTNHMNRRTGCSHGRWNTTTYQIPSSVLSKMRTGTLWVRAGKAGTLNLNFQKGQSDSIQRRKKWDDGWWSSDRCKVRVEYDGNSTLRVRCRGDDGAGRCRGRMQRLQWSGRELTYQ
jgi:hypothetical protein